MVKLDFDSETVEPLGSFEPLPVGEYTVVISSSEMKDAKTGKGNYLQLVYEVIEGDYKGRRLWDRLNIVNDSAQAQEIAQRSLSSICRAVHVKHPQDSMELHDKPFVVKVGIRPAKDDYQASNSIKEYKALEPEEPVKETAKTSAAVINGAKPVATKAKPWEKKK